MSETTKFFLFVALGAGGAAAVEMLKLWEFHNRLRPSVFHKRIRSTVFWVPVIGMLLASGFVAWMFYDGADWEKGIKGKVAAAGAAASALIRTLLSAAASVRPAVNGTDDEQDVSLRDAFF